MPTLVIPDLRDPRSPMRHRPIRLPQSLAEQLGQQAAALGTTESALTRALIVRGSQELAESLAQSAA